MLAVLSYSHQDPFSQIWHSAGPWIQDYRFPDGKEEGDQHLKVLREPEPYKAGVSCGVFYMRICWPELRWNFRKEAACPEERCEQTDSNTLFFNDPQQKKFGASWPRFGGKGEKSGQPAVRKRRSKGEIKVNHRIVIWEIDRIWEGGAGWKRTYNLDKIICLEVMSLASGSTFSQSFAVCSWPVISLSRPQLEEEGFKLG